MPAFFVPKAHGYGYNQAPQLLQFSCLDDALFDTTFFMAPLDLGSPVLHIGTAYGVCRARRPRQAHEH
jgi:hypothetical protein